MRIGFFDAPVRPCMVESFEASIDPRKTKFRIAAQPYSTSQEVLRMGLVLSRLDVMGGNFQKMVFIFQFHLDSPTQVFYRWSASDCGHHFPAY
jgi:hypothetical protein